MLYSWAPGSLEKSSFNCLGCIGWIRHSSNSALSQSFKDQVNGLRVTGGGLTVPRRWENKERS